MIYSRVRRNWPRAGCRRAEGRALDLAEKLVRFEHVPVSPEDGVAYLEKCGALLVVFGRSAKCRTSLLHECGEQPLPPLGEIVRGDDRNSL
eukprot:scaffold219749_cov28-Tisochrysis_lutea.AAC.1